MQYAMIDSNYFCGIDLHARTMFVCIMDKMGEIVFQRNLKNDFKLLLQVLGTHLGSIAVGVESTFNWYWLADGCHKAGIPFYLGHALYMKAIHGGKKKNDRLDSRMLAELMRCNLFPMAYAYPQEMRATRDLLRRRHRFVALRAECYNPHPEHLLSAGYPGSSQRSGQKEEQQEKAVRTSARPRFGYVCRLRSGPG